MPNSDQRSKVTIEALLRLKRTERPSGDFWTNFEREMREKQLSALVEKRAWWHELPRLFTRRVYLPIGATAILAFTLVSVRYSHPLLVAHADSPSVAPTGALDGSGEQASAVASVIAVSSPLINRADLPHRIVEDPATSPVATAQVPTEALPVTNGTGTKDSPSARSIAANLAHLEQFEPELIDAVLGRRLSVSTRLQAPSAPTVELASLTTNGSRRSRLVAHYTDRQVAGEPALTDTARERTARRLADSDFNDHFSRIGLKANRVSLKF